MSQSSLNSSTFEYNVFTPKTKGQNCTRDDRLRIQTLYFKAGYTRAQIVLQLHVTIDQVKYAISHRLTPQKQRTGRRPFLSPRERKQLVKWVYASAKNRKTPWHKIPAVFR